VECILTLLRFAVRQGALFPGLSAMWGRWAPPMERTRLAMISYTGRVTVRLIITHSSLFSFTFISALFQIGKYVLFVCLRGTVTITIN